MHVLHEPHGLASNRAFPARLILLLAFTLQPSACSGDDAAAPAAPIPASDAADVDAATDTADAAQEASGDRDGDGDANSPTDGSADAGDSPHDTGAETSGDGSAGTDGGDAGPTQPCNGHAEYCARPYNQIAQACTHNAMSSQAYGFLIPTPNQANTFTEQLDDGVRCLMLDTFEYQGKLMLCHGQCGPWGMKDLVEGLTEIRTWIDSHPRDVVTLIFEAYISEQQTLETLAQSGLADPTGQASAAYPLYHHDAPPGSPWPTLGAMIESNQRLVAFTDDGDANGTWHLDWRAYGWETPYDDPTFPCTPGRGDPTAYPNQVLILNHFSLGSLGGDEQISAGNNAFNPLLDHALRCWQTTPDDNPFGQIPTFVTVDHYQVPTDGGATPRPDVFDVIEALNTWWPVAPEP